MSDQQTELSTPSQQQYLSLLGRILIPSLLSGLIPLLLIGFFAMRGFSQASDVAEQTARNALDEEALQALQLQAESIANNVEELLDQTVQDAFDLAILPADPDFYAFFYEQHVSNIQYPKEEFASISEEVPLYREMAFLDLSGQEILKIVNGQRVDERFLTNVSDAENTTYGTEDYFSQSENLAPGRIYVSSVTGWHAGQIKQPGNTLDVERIVGSEFGDYEAVIRFVTPHINRDREIDGFVVLSLDHRHVIEQAIHFESTEPGRVVWPDYTSGNYAVLFDHEGYTIAHPRLNRIRGLNFDGQTIDAWDEETSRNDREKLAFNWAKAGFLNQTFPAAYEAVMQNEAGFTTRTNNREVTILTYYQPIPFEHGVYRDSGIFGGVTIGAGLDSFHAAANTVGETIEQQQDSVQTKLWWITAIGVGLLITSAILIARSVTGPIRTLTQAAYRLEEGVLEADLLNEIIDRPLQDEVGTLAAVFKAMAIKVQLREKKLKAAVQKLKIEIDQQKSQRKVQEIVDSDFFRKLEKEANVMRDRRDKKLDGEPV